MIKLLVIFVKILTNCRSFIGIRLCDYLSTDINDYHPSLSKLLQKTHLFSTEDECQGTPIYFSVTIHYSDFKAHSGSQVQGLSFLNI